MDRSISDLAEKIDLFKSLPADERDQVFARLVWKRYRKGTQIINQNDDSDSVYFLGSGSVRAIIYSLGGREISYEDLHQGAMFGELSAIDQQPRSTHVVCLSDCEIANLSRHDFWYVFRNSPQVAESVALRLSSMVRFLCNRVYEFGAMDVKDRIRSEILRMARSSGIEDNRALIEAMPTHQEIANRVRTHREAVTRELRKLNQDGLIKTERRRLAVNDVEALEQLIYSSGHPATDP